MEYAPGDIPQPQDILFAMFSQAIGREVKSIDDMSGIEVEFACIAVSERIRSYKENLLLRCAGLEFDQSVLMDNEATLMFIASNLHNEGNESN